MNRVVSFMRVALACIMYCVAGFLIAKGYTKFSSSEVASIMDAFDLLVGYVYPALFTVILINLGSLVLYVERIEAAEKE